MPNNFDHDDLRIAFCTTCMNRLAHLQQTLPANLADNRDYYNAVFVVLDYGDRQGVCRWVKKALTMEIETGRLVYYREPARQFFQMAHAKNMAHRCAIMEGADILVNLDADNFTGKSFASLVNETFVANENVFLRANKAARDACVGAGGKIALTSRDYWAIGGYDEFYVNWGNDDWNLVYRLERLGLQQIDISVEFAGGIPHSNQERLENYESPFPIEDFQAGRWRKHVQRDPSDENAITANLSDGKCFAGCGSVYRNFDPGPIEIETFAVDKSLNEFRMTVKE